MKLKSLLLGSAAAMIAVSGARAADAIVAEPEPMEYVKVCDMYGAGFFYIPGTETCLKFSGYVRTDFTYHNDAQQQRSIAPGFATVRDEMAWEYRVRFNVDARNETDWGTLRSQIRFQGDGAGGGDAVVGVDRALISLKTDSGELRTGYSDSFTTTFHGYGLPVEKNDGFYSYDQAIFLDYMYSSNGFSIGGGIQNSTGTTVSGDLDIYGGLKYGGSWGNIAASYIYENDVNEGAYKVSAEVNVLEGLSVQGFYIGDNSGLTRQAGNSFAGGFGREWAWGIGASYKITDEFSVNGGYTERDATTSFAVGNVGTNHSDNYFVVGAQWDPIPGLSIRPEAVFHDTDGEAFNVRVYRTW